MKVGIVGTSNSIMKGGYTDGLASEQDIEVEKIVTIGESIGIIFWLQPDIEILKSCNVCIIDFAVNEQKFLQAGSVSPEYVEDYLRSCIAKIWSVGCLPILLILPRLSVRADQSLVVDIYNRIATDLNVPMINIIEMIDQIQNSANIERKQLFQDDGHLHLDIAFAIGKDIGEFLNSIIQDSWYESEFQWTAHSYHYKSVEYFTTTNVIIRQLSSEVLSSEIGFFQPGSEAKIFLDPNVEAIGLCTSLVDTQGLISVEGETSIVFDLSNAYPIYRSGFIMSALAFPYRIPPKSQTIEIKIVERSLLAETEDLRSIILLDQAEYAREKDEAAIGGIFVRQRDATTFLSRPADQYVNINIEKIRFKSVHNAVNIMNLSNWDSL